MIWTNSVTHNELDGFKLYDDVTMPSEPKSVGWVRGLGTDKFGVHSAQVVWEHHGGSRAIHPLDRLEIVSTGT